MRNRWRAAAAALGVLGAALAWLGWASSPAQRVMRIDEAITAMEQAQRNDRGDLLRERADCLASSLERAGDAYVRGCLQNLLTHEQAIERDSRAMQARIDALRSERATLQAAGR